MMRFSWYWPRQRALGKSGFDEPKQPITVKQIIRADKYLIRDVATADIVMSCYGLKHLWFKRSNGAGHQHVCCFTLQNFKY